MCPPQQPDEILALATADPLRMAPPILELEAWIARAVAKANELRRTLDRAGFAPPVASSGAFVVDLREVPVVYELVWRDERIVESESAVRLAHLESENVATGERAWS